MSEYDEAALESAATRDSIVYRQRRGQAPQRPMCVLGSREMTITIPVPNEVLTAALSRRAGFIAKNPSKAPPTVDEYVTDLFEWDWSAETV